MRIINYDKEKKVGECITYGFGDGADIQATDVNVTAEGSTFKVSYKGSSVPFWAKGVFDNDNLYAILKKIAELVSEGKNLVEISAIIRK